MVNKHTISHSFQILVLLFIAAVLTYSLNADAVEITVSDQSAYEEAVADAKPGDTIILKNGVWSDFEILFEGKGNKDNPITLKAETAGEVIISGESNLSLAGEYLVVSGLVFKNGYTPTSSVISFRKSKDELAYHSRVTQTVIDGFNNPERYENDNWVMMYGRHNRFDHNHLEGKKNKGVTMAVRLNTQESQENYHRIDHNYFGPRQILGSNGGETLRIGTSHYSLTDSFTTVENNYFDRCDGELEIISSKSGNNKFIGNVFYESRGTLTMRHGNDTLVEGNVFFGNGADHTGGIRVINKRQTIRNNYMEGLAGYRFGGGLVVMNGVPNSPINRYHQVEESVIENNSLINVDHVQLAAGSDTERSAVPITTEFKNNLIHNNDARDTFTIYDDISGITFAGNKINGVEDFQISEGFTTESFDVEPADNGLLVSASVGVGIDGSLDPIEKQEVGTNWYPKSDAVPVFDHGKVISVKPGLGTISEALRQAQDGDVLSLAAGSFTVARLLNLDKAITLRAESSSADVEIAFERGALFEIQDGGNLKLEGLRITGRESPDSSGNTVIRTQRRAMLSNYQLIIENSEIVDLDINHTFNFLTVSKGTFADRIEITNSVFSNVTGAILSLDKENDDFGIYNAEYVTIRNSKFNSVEGDLVDYYRGGTDESTFGPHFELTDSTLNQVGFGNRNKSKSSILLHGVQVTNVSNNQIIESPAITVMHTVGEPVTKIIGNQFSATPQIIVEELNSDEVDTADLSENTFQTSTN